MFFSKTFERSLSDCFRPKCKCKVIWVVNPRMLLRSVPNLGFVLFYFKVNFLHLELFFLYIVSL